MWRDVFDARGKIRLVSVSFNDVCFWDNHFRVFAKEFKFCQVLQDVYCQEVLSADMLASVNVIVEFKVARFYL